MPIIRISKKQIEEANAAREGALREDEDFRKHDEHLQSLERDAAIAREKEEAS